MVIFSPPKVDFWLIKIAKYWQQEWENLKFVLSCCFAQLPLSMSRQRGKEGLGTAFKIRPMCSAVGDPLNSAQGIAGTAVLKQPACPSAWSGEHSSTCHQGRLVAAGAQSWLRGATRPKVEYVIFMYAPERSVLQVA